jgi:hypothetical protein
MSKEQNRPIKIGDIVSGYKIVATSPDSVMAKAVSKLAPEQYVVWRLDYDKCGVHTGTYCATHEEACKEFAFCVRLETA